MRKRLKRFYNENEDIIGIALFVAGLGAITVGIMDLRKLNGRVIVDVLRTQFDDGTMEVCVVLKNGAHLPFYWPAEAKQ